jgi:predicted site-specific integrase-resolvase
MTSDTATEPELVGSSYACQALGIHPSTLSRWVTAGKLTPFHKHDGIRGAYLFRKSDIDQLQQGQPEASGA